MRVVIQKIVEANFLNEQSEFDFTRTGLVLYIGFNSDDNTEKLIWMARKILSLKLYDKWSSTIPGKFYDILCVMQKSVLADINSIMKNIEEINTDKDISLFKEFVSILQSMYNDKYVKKCCTLKENKIECKVDGPFTAILDK